MPRKLPGNPVFNIEHLRPCLTSPPEFGPHFTLPDARKFLQEGEEYEVAEIINQKFDRSRKKLVYLFRFKWYSFPGDKWLSETELKGERDVLQAYQLGRDLYSLLLEQQD